jgi:isocitrate lyase
MTFADIKAPAGRFDGVTRAYTEQDVQRLRGSLHVENTLAQVCGGCVAWGVPCWFHGVGTLAAHSVLPPLFECRVPWQVGAEKLWKLLKNEPYVHALGALSGNQVGKGAAPSRLHGQPLCRASGCMGSGQRPMSRL